MAAHDSVQRRFFCTFSACFERQRLESELDEARKAQMRAEEGHAAAAAAAAESRLKEQERAAAARAEREAEMQRAQITVSVGPYSAEP